MEIKEIKTINCRILTLIAAIIVMAAMPANILAADDKAVSGSYTYYGHPGMSMIEAKEKALEGAQNEALRNEFGTLVSQDIVQTSEIINDKEKMAFLSSTQSTVRGEWIATTGTPQYEERYENGVPVVTCKVSGRGRKLSNKAPELIANALSAPDKRAVCSDFTDSQEIFVYIKSPERDVFVMVCLEDEDGMVYKMFPFESTPAQATLKKSFDYILFDPNRPGGDLGEMPANSDGLMITTDKLALNRLYIVYSPNYFRKGSWKFNQDAELDTMSTRDFNKLMIELRRADEEMGMKVINLSVKPNGDKNFDYE
ncbi:MAG: hypothetical protein K2I08_03400 [Muribaculaceae bacterium]|nr:hypothetical protein [Muribaculaceae bacterium]